MPLTANLCRFDSAAILFVGANSTPFIVHVDRLCGVSSFFRNAFNSQFKEGSDKKMDLPEDDVDTVYFFVHWLCNIEVMTLSIPTHDGDVLLDLDYLKTPMRALVFADKYDIPNLRLHIFRQLSAHARIHGEPPSEKAVEYAYENTCRGSGIRRFLADWHACFMAADWYQYPETQDWLLDIPEFAIDLLVARTKVGNTQSNDDPFIKNLPKYYTDGLENVDPKGNDPKQDFTATSNSPDDKVSEDEE